MCLSYYLSHCTSNPSMCHLNMAVLFCKKVTNTLHKCTLSLLLLPVTMRKIKQSIVKDVHVSEHCVVCKLHLIYQQRLHIYFCKLHQTSSNSKEWIARIPCHFCFIRENNRTIFLPYAMFKRMCNRS